MPAPVARDIVIEVSPEALFDVIVDYDRYPEFVPSVKQCKARRRAPSAGAEGGPVEVDYVVDLGVKTVRYTLRHHEERPARVAWELVSSDWMKVSNGSWELASEGAYTRARYTVEVQIAKPPLVPQSLVDRITDELTRVQLPRTLSAFKARAESLRDR
jgi:ribosome-associated toxin RatA of RatAB toxin-antitoxin module